jgi:hypothetical protein
MKIESPSESKTELAQINAANNNNNNNNNNNTNSNNNNNNTVQTITAGNISITMVATLT